MTKEEIIGSILVFYAIFATHLAFKYREQLSKFKRKRGKDGRFIG